MDDQERAETYREFSEAVNMTPRELEHCLDTAESREVGAKSSDRSESVGHASGRRILDIKHTKKSELTDAEYAHMRTVVGYVHRHLAQRPTGDVRETRWRYSLMNWGHDPLK